MTKSTLTDLNDHLFAQLERLGDEGLSDKELVHEMKRADAITDIAKQVINNAQLVLDANVKKSSFINANVQLPKLLSASKNA
jgi:hypothetical protein